jgi:hypothetical protein
MVSEYSSPQTKKQPVMQRSKHGLTEPMTEPLHKCVKNVMLN